MGSQSNICSNANCWKQFYKFIFICFLCRSVFYAEGTILNASSKFYRIYVQLSSSLFEKLKTLLIYLFKICVSWRFDLVKWRKSVKHGGTCRLHQVLVSQTNVHYIPICRYIVSWYDVLSPLIYSAGKKNNLVQRFRVNLQDFY